MAYCYNWTPSPSALAFRSFHHCLGRPSKRTLLLVSSFLANCTLGLLGGVLTPSVPFLEPPMSCVRFDTFRSDVCKPATAPFIVCFTTFCRTRSLGLDVVEALFQGTGLRRFMRVPEVHARSPPASLEAVSPP